MSITDELRTWMYGHTVNCSDDRIALVAIADRIDAEHEKAAAGCIHYDPERHYCAVHGDTESGWVRLPLDADGVPIHVGDVLDCDANGYKGTFSVFAVGHNVVVGNHPEEFWYKRPMNTFHVARFCHHHEPTVEDVLTEFADEVRRCCDTADTIAEYAKRLRLAGEDE